MKSLAQAIKQRVERFGPLVLGIDPSTSLLEASGLEVSANGALEMARRILDATRAELAMVKPQMAYFERFGSAGMAAIETLIQEFRSAGVPVLLDGKRGDIDATAQAYAEAYLDPASPVAADALTLHPYLGVDALAPFFRLAQQHGRLLFVVVRSSNPEALALQSAQCEGQSVASLVSAQLSEWNRRLAADSDLGPIGAVVGATQHDAELFAAALPQGWILAPGVGAQGATFADVRRRFGSSARRVLPSVSRGLFARGATMDQLRSCFLQMRDESVHA